MKYINFLEARIVRNYLEVTEKLWKWSLRQQLSRLSIFLRTSRSRLLAQLADKVQAAF